MRNMSKKTRKKVMQIIKANCHFDSKGYWWGPYKSSRLWKPYKSSQMSAIWEYIITEDRFGFSEFAAVYEDLEEKFSPYFYINIVSPAQLTNPRLPINVNKQIVKKLEEGGFI